MRSIELSVSLTDRIVAGYRSVEGYKNMSAALKVPKSTNVFIISKWKRFGTTNSLSRSGCPNKLSNQGLRTFVRQVTKNPAVIQRSFVQIGEPYSPALHQSDFMIYAVPHSETDI